MFKSAASWLGVGGKAAQVSAQADWISEDDLRQALQAMALLMDDDLSGAEVELKKGDSTFHKLGGSIAAFLRATLGFEPEVIREALNLANAAEAAAERDRLRAVKENVTKSSYPPGTEFALCAAEAAIMGAIVGFLSESLVETMKSVAKLRRAYIYLAEIERVGKVGDTELGPPPRRNQSEQSLSTLPANVNEKEETHSLPSSRPASIRFGHRLKKVHSRKHSEATDNASIRSINSHGPGEPPLDTFISAGFNLFYGMIQVILSFIPPSLSRILYLIGFHGDREKGIRMLWEASKVPDVHGAMAGLTLLNYYGVALQICDIVPDDDDDDTGGYPKKKCADMLSVMRERYPKSPMWVLEEAKMLAVERKLEESVEKLDTPMNTQMRQVEAMIVFEKAMNLMFLHRYTQSAEAFLAVSKLNSWSFVLYHYFAGICFVEAYRELLSTDAEKAEVYAALAEEHLTKAPTFLGKKQFMGSNLPLEVFADRKIKKWQAAAKAAGSKRMVDGVGVSPCAEIMYICNGFRKMTKPYQDLTLRLLAHPLPPSTSPDDLATRTLLTSVLHRYQNSHSLARTGLNSILSLDKKLFKGSHRDDWILPAAYYELAVLVAKEKGEGYVEEARGLLRRSGGWESYGLENRMGLRVVTGLEWLGRLEAESDEE